MVEQNAGSILAGVVVEMRALGYDDSSDEVPLIDRRVGIAE